jgi:hypothetical protein
MEFVRTRLILFPFSVNTESTPPEARAVASTESLSVKRTAVINPQSAKLTVTEGNAFRPPSPRSLSPAGGTRVSFAKEPFRLFGTRGHDRSGNFLIFHATFPQIFAS